MLDNGKGLARINVFRHKHEILCGKTSSISHQILGFDENGEVTNYGDIKNHHGHKLFVSRRRLLTSMTWVEVRSTFERQLHQH